MYPVPLLGGAELLFLELWVRKHKKIMRRNWFLPEIRRWV
jgi:hypothetical protein